MMKIAVINGPNLNFLGIREPEIYGKETLEDLENQLTNKSKDYENIQLVFFQSNHEGQIIDFIQSCYTNQISGIIINPGALTHYSYALSDALKSIHLPSVEVHISNIYNRESFRQHSVTAASCIGVISGFGFYGYKMALDVLISKI